MTSKKSDDAISPVIGVMLMLVVTVVIAAAVTIFATGVVGDTKAAPTAVLDVHIYSDIEALDTMGGQYDPTTGPDLHIKHISGDEINTAEIELHLSWVDPDGKYHNSVYSADKFTSTYPNGEVNGRKQPMYLKAPGGEGESNLDHYFGDVTLKSGQKLTAIFNNCQPVSNGDKFGIMKYLPKGTAVEVMILHIPSNKVIYEDEVMVE